MQKSTNREIKKYSLSTKQKKTNRKIKEYSISAKQKPKTNRCNKNVDIRRTSRLTFIMYAQNRKIGMSNVAK